MLQQAHIELSFYKIGRDLLPVDLKADGNSAVLLVNYFGFLTDQVTVLAARFQRVIIDNAHAFYVPPVMREGIMNIYSCRKFFGVCDGALLIGKGICRQSLETDSSWRRATHLIKCYETGTNGAYAESKACEDDLTAIREMSPFTRRVLQGVNYEEVATKRSKNAVHLHARLSKWQCLPLSVEGAVPYLYPLLIDHDIHSALVARHIYVAYLWRPLLDNAWNGTIEQEYTSNIVALPVDQRYGPEQMDELASVVESILQE